MTEIVTGAVSTITELGKDEAWMAAWLSEQPQRLGLGDLQVADSESGDDDRSLVAIDQDRCFSVDVQLGDMEPSRGFGALDNWARNRVRHPDKTHVAVLVTELVSDRYRTTLETLAEHLPLVVVELQVWKGENEAIVIPHVALSSEEVDLSQTPAARAAEVMAATADATATAEAPAEVDADEGEAVEAVSDAEPEVNEPEAEAQAADDVEVSDKDDTGVGNPWGLPEDAESGEEESGEEGPFQASEAGSTGLLSKVG